MSYMHDTGGRDMVIVSPDFMLRDVLVPTLTNTQEQVHRDKTHSTISIAEERVKIVHYTNIGNLI